MLFNKFLNRSFRGDIGGGSLFVVIILLGIVSFATALTRGVLPPTKSSSNAIVTIVPPAPDTEKKNLQLYTFGYITPAPTQPPVPTSPPQPTTPPTSTCRTQIKPPTCERCDHGASMICKETEAACTGIYNPFGWYEPPYTCAYLRDVSQAKFDQKKLDTANCVEACIAKPVIYLYPLAPILVDVSVKSTGHVYISDPLYPDGGWRNVLAYPDGSLTYQNKKYHELYYESDVDKVNAPDNGIVIARNNLKKELAEIVSKLGLVDLEKKEFLEYWIPELNKQNTPYILFSILDPLEKERVDHVDIAPAPDTFIAFIAYFKPLESIPLNLKPLQLPEKTPVRVGFTAVEWGGTIAN